MKLFIKISMLGLLFIPAWLNTKITTITYSETKADFPNPERGFYRYSETKLSNFEALDAKVLKSYRTLQSPSNAKYQVYSSLLFRYYILDDVKTTAIAQTSLAKITADLAAVREAGIKVIPRFVYTTKQKSGPCPEGFICPPYGDAAKANILQHIANLKPILRANADVIACVQLGFIGTWGEQYYSDYFGDASSNGNQQNRLNDKNWRDRAEVLKALLDAVPRDRMVQVRYPQIKQRFIYGVTASINSAPLSVVEAFTQTDKARIGYHNDCFLSSSNDIGTYVDYGNSSSPSRTSESVNAVLRAFSKTDTKYVAVGGETCAIFEPDNNCEPAGRAQAAFAEMHYSYINAHYNNKVNNVWETGGCMDSIKRNLGYRFVLQTSKFPNVSRANSKLSFNIQLMNRGYASPYNPRPVQLVLRKVGTQQVTVLTINTDVRKWYTGKINLNAAISLPASLKKGSYELLLNLPDAYQSIAKRPEYSIRLANEGVWEENTGYNKLNHKITIN